MKPIIFSILFFCSTSSFAWNLGVSGLGFVAPQINGKSNVSGPANGEIVLDTSDDKFYGYDGTAWRSLMDSGVSTYVRATNSATDSLNNGSSTYLSFNTEQHDTDNAFDGTTFTAPSSGLYQATCAYSTNYVSWGVNTPYYIRILVDSGSGYTAIRSNLPKTQASGSYEVSAQVTGLIHLNQGNTLRCDLYQNGGTDRTTSGDAASNFIDIVRLAN